MCDCESAGYCPRHDVYKTETWHRLCQTRPAYFLAWEEGRGPGQNVGDTVIASAQRDCRKRKGADGQDKKATMEVLRSRLKACSDCEQKMESKRNRCLLIDLGCGETFSAVLISTKGKCPLDKWPNITGTDDGN